MLNASYRLYVKLQRTSLKIEKKDAAYDGAVQNMNVASHISINFNFQSYKTHKRNAKCFMLSAKCSMQNAQAKCYMRNAIKIERWINPFIVNI